jgi:hypothetical protein
MELKVNWDVFYSQINDYIKEAEGILSIKEDLYTLKSYEFIVSTTNSWINKCYAYLRNSINPQDNVYAERFYYEKPYSFYLNEFEQNKKDHLKEVFQNLSIKKNCLAYNIRLLSVCDMLIHPEAIDKKLRETFGIKDTIDLLFKKLLSLYDGTYYPIHAIIRGNGIKLKDNKEFSAQLIKYEKEGFIRLISNSSICGQLTTKGKKLVEITANPKSKRISDEAEVSLLLNYNKHVIDFLNTKRLEQR